MLTIHCKIRAIQKKQYSVVVVEDLSRSPEDDLKFITVVLLPNGNFDISKLQIGDEGFLQFEPVEAGKTLWFNTENNEYEVYKYDNNYFINFIPENTDFKMTEFKLM